MQKPLLNPNFNTMKKLFLTCFCCASAVLGARAQDEHIVIWDNASAPTSSGLFGPTVIEKEVFVANNNVAELFVYKAEEPADQITGGVLLPRRAFSASNMVMVSRERYSVRV